MQAMRRLLAVLLVSGSLIPFPTAHGRQQETQKEETEQDEPIVFTNDDLPPAPPSSSAPVATAPPPPAKAPAAIPSYDGYRDRNGHGEGWWRQRAAELDLKILDARIRAETLHVQYVKGLTITDPTLASRSKEATEYLLELEAERDQLPEELRRAGGLPGWLRRGGRSLPSELLPPPEPLEPSWADGVTFSWKPVPDAAFYIVEVECPDCCGPMPCDVRSRDVSGTSARFSFEADRAGRWRLRSLDAAGFAGEWSDWLPFEP
jgi:hypothetical protein